MSDNNQSNIEKWKNPEIFTFGKEVIDFFRKPFDTKIENVQDYAEKVSG